MIYGLSLSRPWPWAFLVAGKRVENRSWKPPDRAIGHWLALHAAKSWDRDGADWLATTLHDDVPGKDACPHSEIFAVCRLGGYVKTAEVLPPRLRPWFFGPYGWVCTDFVALDMPVVCSGARGLWSLADKPAILAQVRETFHRSRAAQEKEA